MTGPVGGGMREALESLLGFEVINFQEFVSALTHKSAARHPVASYERYEFMGDAAINFIVAKVLFDMYPAADEGFLTRVRTKLVSGKCLSELAWRLGLHGFVIMNDRSMRNGFNTNPRILEDVFEALVGCIYEQHGLRTAKTFLLSVFERFVDFDTILRDTNYKDGLMRYAQARGLPLPDYVVDNPLGPFPPFLVRVSLEGRTGQGVGPSKKQAEQEAARCLLSMLGALTATGDVGVAHKQWTTPAEVAAESSTQAAAGCGRQEALESLLGFKVINFQEFVSALTHKSAARHPVASYERYEFIGDAAINFIVAKVLFDMYPAADEGFLTRVRTKLVSGKCLSELAWRLGLHGFVIMNDRSMRNGFNTNPRILEDVFEALVGCIYEQHGLRTAKTFLLSVFERFVDFDTILRDTNYKDGLMRYAQARGLPLPDYVVKGPSPPFVLCVSLEGRTGQGVGPSKKQAEQEAARCLLSMLGALTATGDVGVAHGAYRVPTECV